MTGDQHEVTLFTGVPFGCTGRLDTVPVDVELIDEHAGPACVDQADRIGVHGDGKPLGQVVSAVGDFFPDPADPCFQRAGHGAVVKLDEDPTDVLPLAFSFQRTAGKNGAVGAVIPVENMTDIPDLLAGLGKGALVRDFWRLFR